MPDWRIVSLRVEWRKVASFAGIWVSMKAKVSANGGKPNHFDGIAWENRVKGPIFSYFRSNFLKRGSFSTIFRPLPNFFCNRAKTAVHLYLAVKMQ